MYQGPNWLQWLAFGVMILFSLLIILQSYLKYDFYADKTRPSVVKKSQQGVPILLAFHILAEAIAITQTPLILLLVMNVISIAIIAHLLFMD